jgi:cyanophycinase
MISLVSLLLVALGTSHGPENGYLVIVGGGNGSKVMPRFFELAGGKDARIVYIPTAGGVGTFDVEKIRAQGLKEGSARVDVLHTRDRKVADSEEFVKPLLDATAVWIGGGRHWRLADSYLGTRTEREIKRLLDRGGVVGGSSAGATIQGSFMIRAAPGADGIADGDNRIMESPGHLVGFGLITECTIDQHLLTRHREKDLEPVIAAHPELLGIGIDEGTAIVVHGDTFEVIGPSKVGIYDNAAHGDEKHYFLTAGDKFDLAKRKKIE